MTKIETPPTSPVKKATHDEAELPSTMLEGHATRESRSSSPPRLVRDHSPVQVPPTDMATALAMGHELEELEMACNKFNAQGKHHARAPSDNSWQVVDSVADAFENISLGNATAAASSVSEAGSNQAAFIKKETVDQASENHLPTQLPDVKAKEKELKAYDVDNSESNNNKPADTKPVDTKPADTQPIDHDSASATSVDGSPPYYTPPTGHDEFHLASKFCRCCYAPATYRITKPGNEHGNAGRPYWVCTNKMCYVTMESKYEDGWVSWADGKGVNDENPDCYCGVPSRQDKICKDEGKKGLGFWTCAKGKCDYSSEDVYGVPRANKNYVATLFWPWLL